MSAVDDIRKLLQDLVTPDLKALEAKVTALDEKTDLRFKHLEDKMDERFHHLDEKIDLKFERVYATMAANQQALLQILDVSRRVDRLESERDGNKGLDRPT